MKIDLVLGKTDCIVLIIIAILMVFAVRLVIGFFRETPKKSNKQKKKR